MEKGKKLRAQKCLYVHITRECCSPIGFFLLVDREAKILSSNAKLCLEGTLKSKEVVRRLKGNQKAKTRKNNIRNNWNERLTNTIDKLHAYKYYCSEFKMIIV